jgi:hypothetical protein
MGDEMNNIEKKLDALIDALGFDVVESPVFMTRPDGIDAVHIRTDIKITKRDLPVVGDKHELVSFTEFTEGEGYVAGCFVSKDGRYYKSLIGSIYTLNYAPLSDEFSWNKYITLDYL